MSKRGLSARHSVPNQTLSLVNFRLPKGNPIGGNGGRPGGYGPSVRVPRPERWSWPELSPIETAGPCLPQAKECEATISRRIASELCYQIASLQTEGAGKTGCLLHPRSRVRFCANKNMHTSIQGSASIPAFPAQWLYGLLRALPGERLFCLRRRRDISRQLSASTAAPEPHDFAVRAKRERLSRLLRPSHLTARS
jgi:hypothetical protein